MAPLEELSCDWVLQRQHVFSSSFPTELGLVNTVRTEVPLSSPWGWGGWHRQPEPGSGLLRTAVEAALASHCWRGLCPVLTQLGNNIGPGIREPSPLCQRLPGSWCLRPSPAYGSASLLRWTRMLLLPTNLLELAPLFKCPDPRGAQQDPRLAAHASALLFWVIFLYVSGKDMDRDASLLCLRVGGRVRKFLLILFFSVVFTPLGNN